MSDTPVSTTLWLRSDSSPAARSMKHSTRSGAFLTILVAQRRGVGRVGASKRDGAGVWSGCEGVWFGCEGAWFRLWRGVVPDVKGCSSGVNSVK
eukprot:251366-Chlamydomonas_euryale.AAC.1